MLDLSQVKTNDFQALPDGKYTVSCTDAVLKDTKNGDGEYIKVTFKVRGGQYEGRSLFTNFNCKNPNPKAVEIGQAQLKSFLENSDYTGDFKFGSINEVPPALCGLTVGVKTKTRKSDQYGDQAELSYYFKPETNPSGVTEDNIGF